MMRIRMMAMVSMVAAMMSADPGTVYAGEYDSTGVENGAYRFTDCEKPAQPELQIDRSLKDRQRLRAHNVNVGLYNKYVASANAYMECLTAEADGDIQAHFRAVSSELESQQRSVMVGLDELLVEITAAKPNIPTKTDKALEEELLGGPDPVED